MARKIFSISCFSLFNAGAQERPFSIRWRDGTPPEKWSVRVARGERASRKGKKGGKKKEEEAYSRGIHPGDAPRSSSCEKKKKRNLSSASRAFSMAFSIVVTTPLPPENNENIDPRENDDTLSRRFPGPGDLYRLRSHRRRRRQALRVFRREQPAWLLTPRFFGRLLSKQTFRRYAGSPALLSSCKHVSALSAPAWPYYGRRRMVSTFFSLAAIDKYPNGARYVRKQVESSRILRRTCPLRKHSRSVTCAGREKERKRLLKGFDGWDELHVKHIWQAINWKRINYEFYIFLRRIICTSSKGDENVVKNYTDDKFNYSIGL